VQLTETAGDCRRCCARPIHKDDVAGAARQRFES